ncbi:T9SS type A sorting domain-containing protein [Hymenobacter glacieicola]|uniref:Secretion system C-terminal sorting domain-containing protein n=1 Tax=Hymenobacter glacieicola TaxID=1562124 RepID=A0ABQ1WJ40_9BACT|nr:T9SS type A sorting domain-containing protein [Hymenobacter glacieicola]GGG31356.1 hypothetical protein GCM10011378_04940 [Hymenobacter glacieicola]
MAARVQEYRRINSVWTLIGSVTRDITYAASAGGNSNPTFTALRVGNTAQPFDKAIRVNPGQTVAVTLDATDADAGQTLGFSSGATTTVPGVTLQTLSPTQLRLTWQVPAGLPVGRYRIPVTVTDNGCPFNGTEVRTLTFLVTSQILASTSSRLPVAVAAYPTPFREQVRLQLAQPTLQPITVFDGLGRAVAQLTSSPDGSVLWQPAATLPSGLYVARTANGQQIRLLRE